ncbi:CHAT domain-containing protein [Amylostereum chailletii]|nr:CHAT domain-containing protein [Amylostereum chailletii]
MRATQTNMAVSFEEIVSNLQQYSTLDARSQYIAEFVSGDPWLLARVGIFFSQRFEDQGSRLDIQTAIDAERRAVELPLEGLPDRPTRLNNLGISLQMQFERFGDLVDMDSAITAQRQAADLTPGSHPNKAMYLNNLGSSLQDRFVRLGDLADLDNAIRAQRQAVDLTPTDHASKATYLNTLGAFLQDRFVRLGDLSDIDSAIHAQRQSVELTPTDHASKATYLNTLGAFLQDRFVRLGDLSDIDSAIHAQRQSVELTPKDHADKATYLNKLGIFLQHRFERSGNPADIDGAVNAYRESAELTPEGHADKAMYLTHFGNSLQDRFVRSGNLADIDSAIGAQRQAVELTPEGHLDKALYLNNFGNAFNARFERLGHLVDIDNAIHVKLQSVDLTPEGHLDKPARCSNLGVSLLARFERLGHLADVDSSVSAQRQAVDLTPEHDPDKPMYLNNLGNSLYTRFERLGHLADIDSAICATRQAVDLTPEGYPDKPARFNNLGVSLHARFERSGHLADIDSAIGMKCRAVDLTPEGHPDKAARLSNLGLSFQVRFERFGDLSDLDSAMCMHRQAIDLTPDGHPDKAMYRNNIGITYVARFKRFSDSTDFNAAVDISMQAASDTSGPPSHRFSAAREWATLASSEHSITSALDAYQVVVEIIPRLVWLGSNLYRRYEELPAIAEVVNAAAAAAITAGDLARALEWLEQGRCIVWGQTLQLRTPLDDLRDVDSTLADELELVSHELEVAGTAGSIEPDRSENQTFSEDGAQRHRRLAERYEDLVERARTLPECERFLRPKKLAHLREAAGSGPVVVVNVNEGRCDALILRPSSNTVLHVPFPTLTRGHVDRWRDRMLQCLKRSGARARGSRRALAAGDDNNMARILGSLWSIVVRPVLLKLKLLQKSLNDNPPHITWCATGSMAFLPLHAAGVYDGPGGPKIYDYVVSSYTPTLSALLGAGQHRRQVSKPSVLAVSQPATPGQNPLPGTIAEIAAVKECVGDQGLYLDREKATKDSVLEAMAKHSWIHLACHAEQRAGDPTKSAFILHDSRLELLDIMKKSFEHTELAVLSACQTATGDEKLAEEAVHLAAGMLMAGYPSVVATMWSIKDRDAPVVVEELYSQLMPKGGGEDGRRVAYALHDAVKRLRNEVGEKAFDRWVPFIHIGI